MSSVLRFLAVLAVGACCAFGQSTWYVSSGGQASGTGSSSDPFPTIAAALQAATSGDLIEVGPGTYGETGLDSQGKAVHVRGSQGAQVTVVDATASDRILVVESGETATTLFEGLTFRSGQAPAGTDGGAVRIQGASPTFRGCVFDLCHAGNWTAAESAAGRGGAVAILGGAPRFEDCRFLGNRSGRGSWGDGEPTIPGGHGGAVYSEWADPVFEGCRFQANGTEWGYVFAGSGGGLFVCGGSALLVRCEFLASVAASGTNNSGQSSSYAGDGGHGGGLASSSAQVTLRACEFVGCSSGDAGGGYDGHGYPGQGGAVFCVGGSLSIEDSRFDSNHSGRGSVAQGNFYTSQSGDGGAIAAVGTVLAATGCRFESNWVQLGTYDANGGHGGAIHSIGGGSCSIQHSSFLENEAGNARTSAPYCGGAYEPFCTTSVGGRGGAIYRSGDLELREVVLVGNRSGRGTLGEVIGGDGAALYVTGAAVLENVLSCRNVCGAGAGAGATGASPIYVSGALTMTHCTVVGNSGRSGAAKTHFGFGSSLTNSIFFGNGGFELSGGNPQVSHCLVAGGASGTNVIDADPLFLDEFRYHLGPQSPCLDAGDGSVVTATTDFEGDPRVVRGQVDIGADEATITLRIDQPLGPGTGVVIDNGLLSSGVEVHNLFSFDVCAEQGSGPWLGLCVFDLSTLMDQFMQPLGTVFHFTASGAQESFGPFPFPGALPIDGVSFTLTPSGGIDQVSPVFRYSIQ